MSTVERARGGLDAGAVVRVTAAAGAVATGLGVWQRWAEARRTGEDAYLGSDLTAIMLFGVIGVLVVGLLDLWVVRGGGRRTQRLVLGLAVAAVVTLPLLWWSAVPVVLATSVLALSTRLEAAGPVRAARIAAVLVVAVLVAVWGGAALAGYL